MKTLVCFAFSIAWLTLAFLAGSEGDTALIVAQVWLVGGIVSLGGKA